MTREHSGTTIRAARGRNSLGETEITIEKAQDNERSIACDPNRFVQWRV